MNSYLQIHTQRQEKSLSENTSRFPSWSVEDEKTKMNSSRQYSAKCKKWMSFTSRGVKENRIYHHQFLLFAKSCIELVSNLSQSREYLYCCTAWLCERLTNKGGSRQYMCLGRFLDSKSHILRNIEIYLWVRFNEIGYQREKRNLTIINLLSLMWSIYLNVANLTFL